MSSPEQAAAALARLDEITRRLRRDCPWDREQDERSIVPHTVEEAYELADAAQAGDDAKLVDELGDVLFQVAFLSLLLEERGAGDFAAVAEGVREKLIRRHPHVFGEVEADDAGTVRRNWDEIKRGERGGGLFDDIPETLPSTLYAKKVLRRGEPAGGATKNGGNEEMGLEEAGDLLLAVVERVVGAGVDPELALRAAADRAAERLGERESD
ncbi:MAG: MazG nucleotide pyrophosphohydrolase domain-containing protein [Thermoleophilaceae bacterium]